MGLVAGLAGLHLAGAGPLEAPPLTDPAAVVDWVAEREAPVVAAVVVRGIALAVGWYLLVVIITLTVARTLHAVRAARLVEALALPPVRRLVHGALGVSLAVSVVTTPVVPAAASEGGSRERAPVSQEDAAPPPGSAFPGAAWPWAGAEADGPVPEPPASDGHPPAAPTGDASGAAPDASARGQPLGGGDGHVGAAGGSAGTAGAPGWGTPEPAPDADPEPDGGARSAPGVTPWGPAVGPSAGLAPSGGLDSPPEEPPGHDPGSGPGWTVTAGDHLWGVAEATLAEAWERTPTDAEVGSYLGVLVEANRERLPDPGNPDLVYPGLELTLPEVPDPDAP